MNPPFMSQQRGMSGSNTAVAHQQFIENEKKIRVGRILSSLDIPDEETSASLLRHVC